MLRLLWLGRFLILSLCLLVRLSLITFIHSHDVMREVGTDYIKLERSTGDGPVVQLQQGSVVLSRKKK